MPIKHTLSGLLIATVLALPAHARSLSEILESGVLRSCVPTANPPDGQAIPAGCTGRCGYEGVLGDFVEAFAHSLDLETEYWVSSWDGLFHNTDGVTDKEAAYTPAPLASEECDMVGAIMVSLDWRLSKIDMHCFLPSRMMVVTQKDRVGDLRSISDLGGLKATVEQNMSLHSWIEEQNAGLLADNPITIDHRPYDQTIPAVDAGDADFTVVAVLDALYHTTNLVENSAAAFAVGPVDEGCWGYKKGDEEMGELIKRFWEDQTASSESELNQAFLNHYGLSFGDFVRLVSTLE